MGRNNEKTIRLVLVEGSSDATSLRPYLNPIMGNVKSKVAVWSPSRYCESRGDFTSDENVDIDNIFDKVMERIDDFLNYRKHKRIYKLSHISEVILIFDTDGRYLRDEKRIIENRNVEYRTIDPHKGIVKHWSKQKLRRDFERKRDNLDFLVECGEIPTGRKDIKSIPCSVWFMSSDLEHVLHNKVNVRGDDVKEALSIEFATRFYGNLAGFKEFISELTVPGASNEETWDYLRDDHFIKRSLERHTNLGLLFAKTKAQHDSRSRITTS